MAKKDVAGIVFCYRCQRPMLKDVAHKFCKKNFCLHCFQVVRPEMNGESVFGEE